MSPARRRSVNYSLLSRVIDLGRRWREQCAVVVFVAECRLLRMTFFLTLGHLRTVARAPNNGGCIKLEENECRVDVFPVR